ncbi:tyrosine-type recombinase/integrase [Aquamicrobium defluvii]|uniref:Integrase n=1 Tax=Aquamicrobium defluvii TaxID=69279 RepID=A0A011TEE3_9HYPH|nr:tyrosine-type recombinase/integrase [Aquamicrobium defluvii]EXL10024.1 integrase [Aquamicrobium defluvii]EZQ16798.1 integrase [Halopseudomonas bauzanensis]
MLTLTKRPKSPYWIARGTINGVRFERSTGETSKPEARKKLAAIVQELQSAPEPTSWRDMTFAKAMTAYIDSGKDTRFLDRLLEHFQETTLGAIDNVAMTRAANAIYPGRAPATIRRHLYVPVSAIINFVKDDKLRAPKGGGARTMFVMPALADAIIQAATSQPSPWLPALITFWFSQGTRAGETFAIDGQSDIDLVGRWAMLRDPKNGHERRVTLQLRTVAALSRLPNIGQPGPLFRRFDGKPFTEKVGRGGQVRTAFARAVESAGGDKAVITPHVCRHSWATWFYAQTKDTLRLKEEGGWLSNEHQRYVKLGTSEIAEEAFKKGWDFRSSGENWGNVVPLIAKTGT